MRCTFRQRKNADYMPERTLVQSGAWSGKPDRRWRSTGPDLQAQVRPSDAQPPRRIMSKKSMLLFVAFILSRMNSIASISSIG